MLALLLAALFPIALPMLLGLFLDRLLGEPRRFHPLVGFGRYAAGVERVLRRLGSHRGAGLLAWSAALGWQLRLQVQLDVQTSGLAVSSRWARMKLSPAAHDYLSPLPPGAPLPGPGQAPPATPWPTLATRNHFAVVLATVQAMDWLELHGDGHRRAGFPADGPPLWLQA